MGSSPLARGLLCVCLEAGVQAGIIPARAGFTVVDSRPKNSEVDHPRSRGVYMSLPGLIRSPRGSSPLARGLPEGIRARAGEGWIIPARAGFTETFALLAHPSQDHPRSRGVYEIGQMSVAVMCGSSPLARGLRGPDGLAGLRRRIIPARAGFTRFVFVFVFSFRDHPRSRGVYSVSQRRVIALIGSSPLARGLHIALVRLGQSPGIIPARAGFTGPEPH